MARPPRRKDGADELPPSRPRELDSPPHDPKDDHHTTHHLQHHTNPVDQEPSQRSPAQTSAVTSRQPSRTSTSSSTWTQVLLPEHGPTSQGSRSPSPPHSASRVSKLTSSQREMAPAARGGSRAVGSDEGEGGASPPRARAQSTSSSRPGTSSSRKLSTQKSARPGGVIRQSSPLSSPPPARSSPSTSTLGPGPSSSVDLPSASTSAPKPTNATAHMQHPPQTTNGPSLDPASNPPKPRRPNPFSRPPPPRPQPAPTTDASPPRPDSRRRSVLGAAADLSSDDLSAEEDASHSAGEQMDGVEEIGATGAGDAPSREGQRVRPDAAEDTTDAGNDLDAAVIWGKDGPPPEELIRLAIEAMDAANRKQEMEQYEDDLEDINAAHYQRAHCRVSLTVGMQEQLQLTNRYPDRYAAIRTEVDALAVATNERDAQARLQAVVSQPPANRRRVDASSITSKKKSAPVQRPRALSIASTASISSATSIRRPPNASASTSRQPVASSSQAAPTQSQIVIDLDSGSDTDQADDQSEDSDSPSDVDDEGRPTYPWNTTRPGPLEFAYVLIPAFYSDEESEQDRRRKEKGKGRAVALAGTMGGLSGYGSDGIWVDIPISPPGFQEGRKSRQGKTSKQSSSRKETGKRSGKKNAPSDEPDGRGRDRKPRRLPPSDDPFDSDSSEIIMHSLSSSSFTESPPIETKPAPSRPRWSAYVQVTDIKVSPDTFIHVIAVDDYYIRTDRNGRPVDTARYSIVGDEDHGELVPYCPPGTASSSSAPAFRPFSRGRFEDRPKKHSSTPSSGHTPGEASGRTRRHSYPASMSAYVDSSARTETVQLRTGRVAKRRLLADDDYTDDAVSEYTASTSRSVSRAPSRKPTPRPTVKAARSTLSTSVEPTAFESESRNCHQCRTSTTRQKAECSQCGLLYDAHCLITRYGIDIAVLDKASYVCASCQDHCNCSICLNRNGYRGRVDAFRGLSIRHYLSNAIKGTDFACIKDLLDSKVDDAGGREAWVNIKGCKDMRDLLRASEKRLRDPKRVKGSRPRPTVSVRMSDAEGPSTPAVGAKLLLEDGVELDLATILLGLVPGPGKGKTVDSDGETVSEPEQDDDEVEDEAEKEVTVVAREEPDVEMAEPASAEGGHDENEDQALIDGPSFLHPHLALEVDHDEDAEADDEPDPLDLLSEPRILQFSDDQLGSAFRGEMDALADDHLLSASSSGMDALAEAASQSRSADAPPSPPPDLASLENISVTYNDDEHLAVAQLLAQSGYRSPHSLEDSYPPPADPSGLDDRHHSRTPSSTAVLTPDAFANGFDLLYDDDDDHDGEDGESEEEPFDPSSASRSHSTEDDASAMTLEPWDFGGPPGVDGGPYIDIVDDDLLEYGPRGM